jgi:apolipoprotein N-acyltransferase
VRSIDKRAWMLAVFAGLLQVVIFPSVDWHYLCWFAFAPALVAILAARQRELSLPESLASNLGPATPWQGFLLGWVVGFIWSIGTCFWIYHVLNSYGGLDSPVAGVLLLVFCAVLGLHHAVWGLLVAWTARRRPTFALIAAPFLWVGVEVFRTYITNFPWDLLGTVQVDNIPLARLSTATGVYGLSFEIMLVNTVFAAAFVAPRRRRRAVFIAAALATIVVQATELIEPPRLPAPDTARLVQLNIPILDADQWTGEYFRSELARLREKSIPTREQATGAPPPEIVVWPESPAPFFINQREFRMALSDIARASNAYVIVGSLGNAGTSRQQVPRLFNSAALVTPSGEFAARYDKIHLVPFGEYVPFGPLLGFAEKLTKEVGDFVPGVNRIPFDVGHYKAGVFICYESVFPGEIREFARNGANVFVNISNDGWFGRYGAPKQHLNQARMRAVENDRWLLRATNTGITSAIDPYGRVVDEAPRETYTYLDAPFATVNGTTFYTRHGDWFAFTCAIISVLMILVVALPSRRTSGGIPRGGIPRMEKA